MFIKTLLRCAPVFGTFVSCGLLGEPSIAHHSNNYSGGEKILWQGSIARVSWDGAHVMYLIDVPNADGSVKSWQVLGASPWRLRTRGIKKDTLTAGTVVSVGGYLNPLNGLITPVYLALPNGRKLFVGHEASDRAFMPPPASLPGL